jgi:glycosyltransferase involved in cell wall biosynthesis
MTQAPAARIAVVIPCYRTKAQILGVLAAIGGEVSAIYVVDDACPEETGVHVRANCLDSRVRVLVNESNLGVGGATLRGYRAALDDHMDILVKVDGDGQMDPARIPDLVRPLIRGEADYAKGNRFFSLEDLAEMPWVRLLGNSTLSLVNKMASGYWDLMDPTNGFTALHATVARALPLEKIAHDYFFESDLLFRLATLRAVAVDVPMPAAYGTGPSSLRVSRVAATFPGRYFVRAFKRIFYGYFLRDFNAGTAQLLLGGALFAFGTIFGAIHWHQSIVTGIPATSGTIMLAALPVLLGGQLLIGWLNYDIANVPRRPLHLQLSQVAALQRR